MKITKDCRAKKYPYIFKFDEGELLRLYCELKDDSTLKTDIISLLCQNVTYEDIRYAGYTHITEQEWWESTDKTINIKKTLVDKKISNFRKIYGIY